MADLKDPYYCCGRFVARWIRLNRMSSYPDAGWTCDDVTYAMSHMWIICMRVCVCACVGMRARNMQSIRVCMGTRVRNIYFRKFALKTLSVQRVTKDVSGPQNIDGLGSEHNVM